MKDNYTNKDKEAIFIERTKRLYPYIWNYYEQMIANEMMSADELATHNWKCRKEIVSYVYKYSPFYKQYYNECNFHPDQLQTFTDWDKVPIVTKEMIREYGEDIKVPGVFEKYGAPHFTSGSTGKPLMAYNDVRDANPAVEWRYRGWYLGRNKGEILGNHAIIGVNSGTTRFFDTLYKQKQFEDNQKSYLPMIDLLIPMNTSPEVMQSTIDKIQRIKPLFIQGYTSVIAANAKFCIENSIVIEGVKIVFVAGTILSDSSRKVIEQVFHCPVCNVYGSNELLTMAAECPHSKCHHMHVMSDIKHVEFVDEDNHIVSDGTIGKSVITSFNNLAFPYVRYLLGDRAAYAKKNCCSLPFPSIIPVEGRNTDHIVSIDGKIKCSYLIRLFEQHYQAVYAYQFIQHSDYSVTVRVVPNREYANYDLLINKSIESFSSEYLENKIDLKLVYVDEIEVKNGKSPIVIRET